MKILTHVTAAALYLGLVGFILDEVRCNRDTFCSDPLVRAVRDGPMEKWGERFPVRTGGLNQGMDQDAVVSRLKQAGFQEAEAAGKLTKDVEQGRKVFVQRKSNWVCNVGYYVILAFDDQDRLQFAEGTKYEHGCL